MCLCSDECTACIEKAVPWGEYRQTGVLEHNGQELQCNEHLITTLQLISTWYLGLVATVTRSSSLAVGQSSSLSLAAASQQLVPDCALQPVHGIQSDGQLGASWLTLLELALHAWACCAEHIALHAASVQLAQIVARAAEEHAEEPVAAGQKTSAVLVVHHVVTQN